MKATSLLIGWTCRHLGDTAPGKTVTLPHDAMLAEPRTALSAGGTNTGWYEGYDYEYRRTDRAGKRAGGHPHSGV